MAGKDVREMYEPQHAIHAGPRPPDHQVVHDTHKLDLETVARSSGIHWVKGTDDIEFAIEEDGVLTVSVARETKVFGR